MGDSVDNAVNEVFYERSRTFVRESLLCSGKEPSDLNVVCYPDVTEADIRAYSELGVPKSSIAGYKQQKEIDALSISTTEPINGNIPVWLIEEIAGKHALADKAVVATHFAKSDFEDYAIPPAIITCIALGMSYVNLNPIFARNPRCDEFASKVMHAAEKLEQGETDLNRLLKYMLYNTEEQPDPDKLEEFHTSQKGFLFHVEFLQRYTARCGFPIEFADLAIYYGGRSHTPNRHWSYQYKTESGQSMLVDLFLFDRFKRVLERYKDLFDKIYNGLENIAFESEEQKQLFFSNVSRDYNIIGRIVRSVFCKKYKRKQLQPVQKINADHSDIRASTEEEFESFVDEVRKKRVLFYDPDIKRSSKNRERLGLKPNEAKDCNTIKDIGTYRRGIGYYMGQQEFGLFVVQEDANAIDALETIGLNSNGNASNVVIVGSGSSKEQVDESVRILKEMGIKIKVRFLDASNGHINEKTKLANLLRQFA